MCFLVGQDTGKYSPEIVRDVDFSFENAVTGQGKSWAERRVVFKHAIRNIWELLMLLQKTKSFMKSYTLVFSTSSMTI